MMSGRENLSRAIEFRNPEYLPCSLDVALWYLREQDEAKLERIRGMQARFPQAMLTGLDSASFIEEPVTLDGVTRWIDEWLTEWADDGHGGKTEGYPLAGGWGLLDGYPFPDPLAPGKFATSDDILRGRDDLYVRCTVWFTLFERLWMLRGFENLLADPYLEEGSFVRLRDRVVEYNLTTIDQWIARGVDAVFFSDDWGCQRGLLMNPDDWRRYYKPSYQAMFRRARDGGAHVWMHLCGDVSSILGDLIDIGLNVLTPVQPRAMDCAALAREYGGKVCFNGGIDVQSTLIFGTPEDVRREVHELIGMFGGFGGGYIAGTSHIVMPETPLDNVVAMYEALTEYQPHGAP
jgi:uroporphyrinogen decarboxylase